MRYKYYILILLMVGILTGSKRTSVNGIGNYLQRVEGMTYIKGGTFLLGQTDSDSTLNIFPKLSDEEKTVSITSFFMDESAVTNKQYREFVKWVKDSIVITKYLNDEKYFLTGISNADKLIDWSKVSKNKSFWSTKDENTRERLQGIFYQGDDRIFGRDDIDINQLKYSYDFFDLKSASENRHKNLPRSSFIFRDTVSIYPDTLVWMSDFQYSQNEAYAQSYFSNPVYDDYPVVGVTWKQANAYNHWRSKMLEKKLKKRKDMNGLNLVFQLPTDAQWEYASRGGKKDTRYPWGNELHDGKDCLFANFKVDLGNYITTNLDIISPARSFAPNPFGLYNMAGNVAEWTSSSFDESANIFVHDLNPNYSYDAKDHAPDMLKRKVIRGGSWKDSEYFLRNSTRTFEYQDRPKSYIGFRSIIVVHGYKN